MMSWILEVFSELKYKSNKKGEVLQLLQENTEMNFWIVTISDVPVLT